MSTHSQDPHEPARPRGPSRVAASVTMEFLLLLLL